MGYGPSYGQALGCIPRRSFCVLAGFAVLACSLVKTVLFLWDRWYNGTNLTPDHPCWDVECYEVFSCKGMLGATTNMREPLDTLAGLVFGFAGMIGGIYGRVGLMALFAYYLFWAALLQCLFIVSDLCLAPICGAFPDNVVDQGMLFMPISSVSKQQLKSMPSYPMSQTYAVAQQTPIWVWYLVAALLKMVVLALCSNEVFIFSRIMDSGVWGIGVNYDLRQMDPVTMAKRKAITLARRREDDESEPDEDEVYGFGRDDDDDDVEEGDPSVPLRHVRDLSAQGQGEEPGDDAARTPGLRGYEPAEAQSGFYVNVGDEQYLQAAFAGAAETRVRAAQAGGGAITF